MTVEHEEQPSTAEVFQANTRALVIPELEIGREAAYNT